MTIHNNDFCHCQTTLESSAQTPTLLHNSAEKSLQGFALYKGSESSGACECISEAEQLVRCHARENSINSTKDAYMTMMMISFKYGVPRFRRFMENNIESVDGVNASNDVAAITPHSLRSCSQD